MILLTTLEEEDDEDERDAATLARRQRRRGETGGMDASTERQERDSGILPLCIYTAEESEGRWRGRSRQWYHT